MKYQGTLHFCQHTGFYGFYNNIFCACLGKSKKKILLLQGVSINKINPKLSVFEYYNCTCMQVHEQQNM